MFLSRLFKRKSTKLLTLFGALTMALGVGATIYQTVAQEQNEAVETKAVNATAGKRYYFSLANNYGNWEQSGAWFAVYLFNDSSNTWVKLTQAGSSHYYYFDAPSGTWPKLIFVRMKNTDTSSLSFENSWNQTGDIKFENNDLWTMNGSQWGDNKLGASGYWGSSTNGSTRIFTKIDEPTVSSMRYWFYPSDTSTDGGHFFNGGARLGVYVTDGSDFSAFYLTTKYQDYTNGPNYYYVDLPSSITTFQFARVASGSDPCGLLTVWNWGDYTYGVSDYPASKFWYVHSMWFNNNETVGVGISANGSDGYTTTFSGYTTCAILSAYYTCQNSVNNGYAGCSNLYATVWSRQNTKNGSFTTSSNPGVPDYSQSDWKSNSDSYEGLSRATNISATDKWVGMCKKAGINPNTGAAAAKIVYLPSSSQSPLTMTLWIVLGTGLAGLAAIGVAYFVSKKRRRA